MSRPRLGEGRQRLGFPRVSGNEPEETTGALSAFAFSPRERG